MVEGYRGQKQTYESYRQQQAELKENENIKETLQEIQTLLSRLIEKGWDLSAQVRNLIRQQIQALLLSIGVNGFDDYEGLMAVYQRVQEVYGILPVPAGFMSREDFRKNMSVVYYQENPQELPPVPSIPTASQVSQYGVSTWRELEGRGGTTPIDYLYNLAILMSNKNSYKAAFPKSDIIQIGASWTIENGRHRSLALKCLGSTYIEDLGMNDWVKIRKEE